MQLDTVLLKHNKNTKFCLYSGSFDPFHVGHLEIVKVLLDNNYVDVVIIIPNNPNKSKPLRTELKYRVDIIEKSIANVKNAYVVYDDVDTVRDKIATTIHNNRLYSVMGDDQYKELCEENKIPKLLVDEWFIVPRHNHNIANNNKKWVKVTCLPKKLFCNQEWSSTYIRENIMNNKSYVLQYCLDEKILKHIIEIGIYSLKTTVEKKVMLIVGEKAKFTYIRNNVIDVTCDGKRVIVKVFSNMDEYKHEISSYSKLEELQYKGLKLKTPKVLFSESDKQYSLLGLSYEGKTAETLLYDDFDAFHVGTIVGEALKMLHSFNRNIYGKTEIKNNGKLKNVKREIRDQTLLEKFYDNPGATGYIHGDVNLGNFIIDEKDCTVTLIDFNGISKYGNSGIPAYEYYQFISGIHWLIIDKEKAKQIEEGFIDGYGETGFTKEAIEVFKPYWIAEPTSSGYKSN